MTPQPYAGPVEALTVEAAAARLGCSAEHFLTVYDGPRVYLGTVNASMFRIPAYALHEWLVSRAFTPGDKAAGGSAWDTIGDGTAKDTKGRVPKRAKGKAGRGAR